MKESGPIHNSQSGFRSDRHHYMVDNLSVMQNEPLVETNATLPINFNHMRKWVQHGPSN